jgi:tetratricopeptide (TPR) repeat protein
MTFDAIKSARQSGNYPEAQRLIYAEIQRNAGKVSSGLADQLALLHMAAYNWSEARDLFLLIAARFPDNARVWRNIGQCSEIMGDYDTARDAFRESVQCFQAKPGPDSARAWFGLGAQLFRLGMPEIGEAWWREGLTKDATSSDAIYQRAQVKLALGMYEEGWQDFEARKQLRGYNDGIVARGGLPNLPEWDGKSRGLVRCVMSQGAGDVVMLSRYLPLIEQASGYPPMIHGGKPLQPWLDASFDLSDNAACDPHDFVAHLDSMPLLLRRPEPIPPHCTNPWRRPRNPLPRIGICWKGSPKHLNDKDRSSPGDPRPLLASEKWELVSLQHGHDFAPKDYQETAELMRTLDAVVTVDTSVVHVAGTLGVPTICIPPSCPEWRWGIRGETTPWYPSVTMVRRTRHDAWGEAWSRAKRKLEEMTR